MNRLLVGTLFWCLSSCSEGTGPQEPTGTSPRFVAFRQRVVDDALRMDIGRCKVVALPADEIERRSEATTSQWPIMSAVLYGVDRDQLMANHMSNHIQVVYATDAAAADHALAVKAAMAEAMGIDVTLCGTNAASIPLAEVIAGGVSASSAPAAG